MIRVEVRSTGGLDLPLRGPAKVWPAQKVEVSLTDEPALGEFDTLLVTPQILLAKVGYSATVGA